MVCRSTRQEYPEANELYDYMTKKFGKIAGKGWRKCRIVYDDDDINEEDENETV